MCEGSGVCEGCRRVRRRGVGGVCRGCVRGCVRGL